MAQTAYPVTTTNPTGVGSLAQAVADINVSGQPGLVNFMAGSAGTISLSGGLTLNQTASFVNASGGDVAVTLSGATNVTTLTAASLGTVDGANVISFSAQSTGDNATAIASAGSLAIDAFGYAGNATAEAGGDGAFGIRGDTGLSIGSMDGVVSAQAAGDGAFGLSSGGSVSIGSWRQGAVMAVAGGSNASGVSAGGDLTLGTMSYGQIMATTLGSDACGLSAAGDIAIGTMTDTLIVAQAGTGDAYGIVSQGNLTITTLGEGIIYALTPGDRAYALSAVGDVSIGRLEGAVVGVAQGDDAVGILGNGAVTIGTLAEDAVVGASADSGSIAIDAMNGDITVDALQGIVMAIAESGEAVGLRTDAGYHVVIGGMSSDGYIQVVSDVGSAFGIASGGDVVLGGLSGTVDVFSGGNTAVGIQAQGGIHGAGGGSAILSGEVSAEAEGLAVAVAAAGPMDLYVTGVLAGVDASGGGQGYAIRAGVSDGAGGWIVGTADNRVSLGTGATLFGAVDLGIGGNNTLGLVGTGAVDNLFLGVDHLVAGDGLSAANWNLSLSAGNASIFGDLAVGVLATLRINENVTITGDTQNDGSLVIDLGADKTYGGDITGTGSLIKDGDAVLTLAGDNSYSGGTAVMEGLLRVTGTLDSSQYHIFSGAAFQTWQDVTLHRTSLVAGTLTAPLVAVAGDGTLLGTGTINGNVVNNGVIAPGTSIGTMTVNGNLTLAGGGVLAMEINPFASDLMLVSGLTTLGGALSLDVAQGFYRQGQSYTLISSAGGLAGGFQNVAASGSPFLVFSLSTTATDVTATVNRLPYTIAAASGNAAAAGLGLTGATLAATPALQQILGSVDFMSTAQVSEGLAQLSPEPYSALVETSFSAMRLFSDTIRDRAYAKRRGGETLLAAFPGGDISRLPQLASSGGLRDIGGTGAGQAGAGDGFGLFVKPVGQYQTFDNGHNRTGFQSWQYGVMAGGDAQLTDAFLAGFQVGYVHSDLRFKDAADSSGFSDAFLGGLYASVASGGFYFDGLVQAGAAVNHLDRRIAFGGVSREPSGAYTSFLFGGSLATGYEWTFGAWKAGPVGTLDYGYVNTPGFAESDPDLGLTVSGFSGNSLKSGLGAKVTGTFALGETTTITPDVSLRWGHEFLNDSQTISARFNGSPTSGFSSKTGDPARDVMLLDAGVSVGVTAATSLYARYSGQFLGQGAQTQAGAVGIRYEF
ncbi:autotransporter domain-containing protein [Desulfovibrio sulfodismutans]|uniref:Autotransporter domain-containing protein n=1 Tax=Desulfolutivibrio sulfodismutans TaxID=63561 RepID=A0A7K3NQH7_9BACT|nr:autotransporter domain-containing protein [Desulfolutivibrio sulfodismutans]NDY58431.1 autotransporter domain-containing protein [Desulfolutivibrio sulfodismutans]QLA12095.1 autotransporter domain-containing protein [Desulfolutivibrio sulfodismutans DSM 3696]